MAATGQLIGHQTYDIGWAVQSMKLGYRVARQGWNGKGMYLFLAERAFWNTPQDEDLPLQSFVVMKTVQDRYVPWLCSQTDLLAEDWEVVD